MLNLNSVLLVFVSIAIVQSQFLGGRDLNLDLDYDENDYGIQNKNEVAIYLYTLQNLKKPNQLLLNDGGQSIKTSHFNPTHPTRFYISNFGTAFSIDCLMIRNSYLSLGNFNIIMINMGNTDEQSSIPHIENLGLTTANMIRLLSETQGVNPSDITVIGYGTGAHAAGFAGRSLKKNDTPVLGNIVAIEAYKFVPGVKRLKKTDALNVQAIITSPYAIRKPFAHSNFYVNYGVEQPGCGDSHARCTHPRSYFIFAESLVSKAGFVATRCGSISEIDNKACVSSPYYRTRRMGGEPLDESATGVFYVPTHNIPPYALGKGGVEFESPKSKLMDLFSEEC